MASLHRVKRLAPGAFVIVQGRFRQVSGQERRKQGIGVLLRPVHAMCGPKPTDADWCVAADLHIPGTPITDAAEETD